MSQTAPSLPSPPVPAPASLKEVAMLRAETADSSARAIPESEGTPAAPHAPRVKTACFPAAQLADCISGTLSGADKAAFVSALDDADIKLCTGDHLNVVSRPSLSITSASGVRRSKQEHFILALLGARRNISFSGEVVIRCKGR
jgi:hypothetical protein